MDLAAIKLIKIGDWLTILLSLMFIAFLTFTIWDGDLADRAIIRSKGKIYKVFPLSYDQQISVTGPLGISIINIHDHMARVSSDPSPRQICVRQGWLQRSGEIALCLPNQVSLELAGKRKIYDSLNY